MKTFRTNGAIGALLDEYEKSIKELESVLEGLSQDELIQIADPSTKDPDCRSIQTILTHVVKAGYGYAIAIRRSMGEEIDFKQAVLLETTGDYKRALWEMFDYNQALFNTYPTMKIEEHETSKKIQMSWGQTYDPEQLMEHAIVHILRHRRQIERFLIQIRKPS